MSKAKVWWTAIGSFFPFILLIIGAITFFLTVPFNDLSYVETENPGAVFFGLFMVLTFLLAGLDYLIMTIYLLIDTFNNPHTKDNQVAWVLVILLASFVGFPVYWYLNIYKHRIKDEKLVDAPLS